MEFLVELPAGKDDPAELSVRALDPVKQPFPNNARPRRTRGCRGGAIGVARGITGAGVGAGVGADAESASMRSRRPVLAYYNPLFLD